ncbi:MAG: hypothetical protein M3082_08395 [Candidatus Dormibacteraeota bacterium]|nr:hypothetical protein [Candidatus Dormibacteraeota bacterium]
MNQSLRTAIFKSKRKVVYVLLPAAVLVGVGSIASAQAASPMAAPAAITAPDTTAEAPESTDPAGSVESTATDPAGPAGAADTGHQDTGDQADHQFDGEE